MGVKTAISIPDELFEAADRLARRQGLSRSALYRRAVERYLAEHETAEVTARLDAVYEHEESGLESHLLALELASLPDEDW
jgi:metal-responsive CopG/Arc/MetJ family transcriptional regulator